MAIYHFSVKLISRANGSSALASAAYRAAGRLHDRRLGRTHDFSNKAGVVHTEVLLPENAPEAWRDREQLWNAVEAVEKRVDAQLSREVEFAIPKELSRERGIDLARDFVRREFVDRGMVADLTVHWEVGTDGEPRPHAHVMLTTREVRIDEDGAAGFGAKVREWNRTDLLQQWRERWADHVNTRLAELDIDARVDHRSLQAQGVELEPQSKIGPAASRMVEQGLSSERLDEHHAVARANGDRILARPEIALDAITRQQSTFTRRDLAMFVHRQSDGQAQFDRVLAAVQQSPELVALGRDGRGEERFTARAMLETEQRLEGATNKLAQDHRHSVSERHRDVALARAAARDLILSTEQRAAFEHVTAREGLGIVVGYAGTGKSAMLGVAREAWEGAGYRVQGLALSGIAAENLESGSQIPSRTIASLEHQWSKGEGLLTSHDVLVVDEAGMIGTRQMERIVSEAQNRGAKVVLVGDPEQLQAIEAGAAFRSIAERHGGVEITTIRRQHAEWQREATRQLATGRTADAVSAYDDAGHVHVAPTREAASDALIGRWDKDRLAAPATSRIILTHTNDAVQRLNEAARERLRASGALGPDIRLTVERGSRDFAAGDRVMFLKNERSLGVKNGSLGTVQSLTAIRMAVLLDDGRPVAFDLKDYAQLDHGYAATIHKAQGMTVDNVHVLATPGLDRHASYVALSRHRDRVDLHYGTDDFSDRQRLVRTLSRDRGKDMASDYGEAGSERSFAERRGIRGQDRVVEVVRRLHPEPVRAMVEQLNLPPGAAPLSKRGDEPHRDAPHRDAQRPVDDPEAVLRRQRSAALRQHARVVHAIHRTQDTSPQVTRALATELRDARTAFEAVRPHGWRDAEAAYSKQPELAAEAATGNINKAIAALQHETRVRLDLAHRADLFVARWNQLSHISDQQYVEGHMAARRETNATLAGMARSLERDPQLESLLAIRKRELGIYIDTHHTLGRQLTRSLAIDYDIGRDRGIGL